MPESAADDVDLIVLATSTPDHTFPATATQVQARLGMSRGAAFDVQAVCSGFVYALAVADNFIKVGQARTALVIGAETFSRILDWNDRGTCVLFGDGAGAVVLQAGEGNGNAADRGVLTTHLYSDGQYYKLLYVDGGPSATQSTGHLRMEGREVFRHAVVKMGEAVDAAIGRHGHQRPRSRLAGAPSGQSPDHRQHGPAPASAAGEGHRHRRPPCQYLGRFHPAGARTTRSGTGASGLAIWCCWRPWAAASPGAPRSSAGSLAETGLAGPAPCRANKMPHPSVIDCFPTRN